MNMPLNVQGLQQELQNSKIGKLGIKNEDLRSIVGAGCGDMVFNTGSKVLFLPTLINEENFKHYSKRIFRAKT